MGELTAEMIVDGLVPADPQIAPNGRHVAFVVAPLGRREEHPQSAIWLARTDGSAPPRQITAGAANDRTPCWSPDGEMLYFLSDRSERGKAQLYCLPLGGGEAVALTTWKPQIEAFVPLPDGRTIALLAVDPPSEEDERRKRERDDRCVFGERWPCARLRLLDLATREVRTIDHPCLRERHIVEVASSLDGAQLAAISWPTPEFDNWARHGELHVVDLCTGEARTVCTTLACANTLTWNRDGRRIYYLSNATPERFGGLAIFGVVLAEGVPRMLAEDRSACPVNLCRGHDGDLLVTMAVGLDSAIDRLDPEQGQRARLSSHRGDLRGLSVSDDGRMVAALYSTATQPAEVWAGPPEGPLTRLTDLRPELRAIALGEQERLSWTAPDGLSIDGLLILPPGKTRADCPFPLITIAHGGPYDRFADSFQLGWYPSGQWLATHGYAVLLPNPRGGLGHGHEFAACVAGAVGVDDFGDIMAGIDALIAQGVADPDHLGIGGWSQGGFMTGWAVGQTRRFRAGVVGAGVSDWGMMVADSDLPYWEGQLGGFTGWQGIGPHQHTALSPISFVHQVTTPVLILHGEQDKRVPVSQGRFFARGLREYGVPYEFVVYPRQPHRIEERNHQLDVLCRTRSWFDRWLRPESQ